MKKLLLLTTLSTSLLFSNDIFSSIGLNIGFSSSSYDKKDHSGSITLGNEPNEPFSSFELYTTLNPILPICKQNNMKPYLSYTYSSNTDLKHQYILAGVNKYYNYKKFSIYAGALLGYGQIDWRYDPLNTSKSINVDANSFIGGIQMGIDYPLNNKLSLGINTKALFHNYETNLNPSNTASTVIEHDNSFNISLGIRYNF